VYAANETRAVYVNRYSFKERPFSDIGLMCIDLNELDSTFLHYQQLTISSQWQYSRAHQLGEFNGDWNIMDIYQVELALLRDLASVFVVNKEHGRSRGFDLSPTWGDHWNIVSQEFVGNYFPAYKRSISFAGGIMPQNFDQDLREKIERSCEVMKTLLERNSKDVINIFFRFGTVPEDMREGKLYSPLNDVIVYFG
jgi:hypothetical protein